MLLKQSDSEHDIETDPILTSRGFVSNHYLRFPRIPDVSWFVFDRVHVAAARFSDDFLFKTFRIKKGHGGSFWTVFAMSVVSDIVQRELGGVHYCRRTTRRCCQRRLLASHPKSKVDRKLKCSVFQKLFSLAGCSL